MKWPTVKLKSVTSKVGSGATPKGGEAVYKNSGIPLIRSMNVHSDGFRRDGLVYIDEDEASLLNHVEIQSEDVLFNITGASIGRVTTAPADMAGARVNQHVCILRPTDKLMPRFLSYHMRSPDQQVLVGSNQIGGTRQAVTRRMLLNWDIHLPPLAEQERIVKLLDEADELRKLRAQADRRTAALIQSLFHELFGDPISNPHKWPRTTLADACNKIVDGTHFSPPPTETGVPYITAKHLREYGLDFERDHTFVSADAHREIYARCDPKPGDVLYIKDGATTGLAAVNRYDFEFSMLSSLALLRPSPSKCNSEFLCEWFNNKRVKAAMLEQMAGAAIRRLTLVKIKKALVLLPPLSLQKEFAARVSEIRALQAEQVTSRSRLENLFQSLLHRAFKGAL